MEATTKGVSKEYELEEETKDFRNGLSTWRIHTAWTGLPVHFRAYRLLLEYFRLNSPNETLEGDLSTLVFIIEEMLDKLAVKMKGTARDGPGERKVPVKWTNRDHRFNGLSYTPQPILVSRGGMLEMRPRIDKDQQKAVISRFSLYLEELERLLAVKYGPRAEDLGIANPYIGSVDMVGWSLGKLTDEDVKPQDLHQDPNAVSSEAQLETSECRLEFVQEEDLGRFRGIARLSMRFQGQRTGKGTGWLVDSRTIATAGHCVYDPNLGFLEWVKVTFGSETENPIELHGTHAVVHWCYYVAFSGKSDLGFIRLESSVVGVSPLSFTSTPWKSSTGGELTARGYPNVSDQPERMRESKCEAKYNLLDTDWSLEYELATDRGSSGCPIFDQDRNVIGTHSRVDIAKGSHRRGKLINKGVIIDARDNNPAAFCAVLDHLVSKDKLDDRDPKGRSDPRFVARPMSNGVTGYTVHSTYTLSQSVKDSHLPLNLSQNLVPKAQASLQPPIHLFMVSAQQHHLARKNCSGWIVEGIAYKTWKKIYDIYQLPSNPTFNSRRIFYVKYVKDPSSDAFAAF
ncbi:hypothetical protein MRS44_014413 [Fusarium solani]|uniref:uncharacterized protein n=1 Tax=Fusarium solani TaxID=169388 RepID=UPI0032C47BB5|nr:hypothetical protein MRS44_014413 [Fusarium solani]